MRFADSNDALFRDAATTLLLHIGKVSRCSIAITLILRGTSTALAG
jgi:hypothetical protein